MTLSSSSLKDQLEKIGQTLKKDSKFAFIIFFILVYGFLTWRISTLLQAEPSQTAVVAELESIGVGSVNEDVVNKMIRLRNSSVSVQTLFDEARDNPFQEDEVTLGDQEP